ncbi:MULTISPECIES: carboxymuconolactone decarboxylase family protein [Streptomyces]|uniref:carboxymuconolactone decarboxylase family protein n=1 Tax=Streptomyces TaxID=1883 RepID=UPI0023DD3F71|nr:carboxymuconolactone decarboxylase family protein [Streptomyces sp. FXJ1.172]WEP00608.1 carboxymuconolactone decarboxylase family protein [Streptomyces sp. FXJ1.172]
MPRLPDPDPASFPAEIRAFLASLPPDSMVRMLSHSAGTVKPFVQLAKAQFTGLELPARSRELVILTVAEYTGSTFVAAQHNPMSQTAGVDERTRQLIRARQIDSPELSPSDRALLRFTAEVVQCPRVPDELFETARAFLTDRELVEVLQVVGYYWSFGRISTVLDVEVTKVYGDESVLDTPSH